MPEPSAISAADPDLNPGDAFSGDERDAVYKAIFTRRDVRSEFLSDPVSDAALCRILTAAHHAPSVGLSQPWNFIVIREQGVRRKIADVFSEANAEAAEMFPPNKRSHYRSLKLQGIVDAPLNLCVTSDRTRGGTVLGATHMSDMDVFSTVCAVQNLWLAARAEGLGVGWVSILKEDAVKAVLGIPDHIRLVAYLCVGHVSGFFRKPELEHRGWRKRAPITDLVYKDGWGTPAPSLHSALRDAEAQAGQVE